MRIGKFALVGGSGVMVNTLVLWLLTEIFGIFYVLSAVAGVETSLVTNFIIHERWTFTDGREGHALFRFGKYNLTSLTGMGINIIVLYMLTSVIGIYYLVSNLIAACSAFLFNYFISAKWVWHTR